MFSNTPIRRKVMAMLLLTSGTVLLLTCMAFIAYEFQSYRQSMLQSTKTLGQVVATNATAALAFDNPDDATEILSALQAEPQVVAAALYTKKAALFATYPAALPDSSFPKTLPESGYRFVGSFLIGVLPVSQGDSKQFGTLYLKLDQSRLYTQLWLYSVIALTMTAVAFLVAYLLSRTFQRQISVPVLNLARTASKVAAQHDYTLRAQKLSDDEVGFLTDAFNQMLGQIETQNGEVRESEARLRAVLDSALSAVITMDHAGKIIDWNPRATQMFGWDHDEILGRDLADTIIPVSLREQHRRSMQLHQHHDGEPVLNQLVELQALRRDGSEFPVELSISPLHAGATTTFCEFITDITERKQAQHRVQEQLGRLDLLHRITRAIGERQNLQSIFQVVLSNLEDNLPIDFGCIFLYQENSQSFTANGVGPRSVSSGLAEQVGIADGATFAIGPNGLSRCMQGQLVYESDITVVPFEFARHLASGGLRSLVVAPLLAESKVFGALVAARNQADGFSSRDCEFLRQLSEHVALAAHQVQLYADLQQAYQDLRQSQQSALQQERLRALGQMASGVAHDINNAISPVVLYTETLLEREPGLSERARNYLVIIQRAIDDVAQTVSRMRDFYRAREPQLSLARIDLNRIVQQVIDLTRARWRDLPQQRGVVIEVKTELAAQLPVIMGAENEIRDALTNLIFNAVDAMPEGGTLSLRTGVLPQPHGLNDDREAVAVEVTDTGVGMDEQARRQCLEPFYTTKGERGTGMGLAMVYGTVKRHSAELQIDSAPNAGTTVRMVFTSAASTVTASRQSLTAKCALSPLHILVVDDDPVIIEALCVNLQRDGHQVTVAAGGQAGIDAFLMTRAQDFTGHPIDVLITDLGMPFVDGRRVAAAIKRSAPTLPIIMLTGWGQRLMDEGQMPEHVDRLLSKPVRLEELRRVLAELIVPSKILA